MSWNPFRRKTNFKAGGLVHAPAKHPFRFAVPLGWEYPAYIDGRPYLLPSDDQGRTNQCTAYALRGIQEAISWWMTGHKENLDPTPLYLEAKRLDGEPNKDNGTTLDRIIEAAENLDLLQGVTVYDVCSPIELRYALHKFPLVLIGLQITDKWNDVGGDGVIAAGGNAIGGHAIVADYVDDRGFGITNSWGMEWGKRGKAFVKWELWNQQFMSAKGFSINV
jgi:hypothetical protein